MRLYSHSAYDWTLRLSAIAAAADQIKAKRFTIDGEAVVLGPDGLSRFAELRNREAAHAAILYGFDLMSVTAKICAIAKPPVVPPGTDHGHLISFPICRDQEPIRPMTAACCRHGVHGLFVICQHCGHKRVVSIEGEMADRLPYRAAPSDDVVAPHC